MSIHLNAGKAARILRISDDIGLLLKRSNCGNLRRSQVSQLELDPAIHDCRRSYLPLVHNKSFISQIPNLLEIIFSYLAPRSTLTSISILNFTIKLNLEIHSIDIRQDQFRHKPLEITYRTHYYRKPRSQLSYYNRRKFLKAHIMPFRTLYVLGNKQSLLRPPSIPLPNILWKL